MQKHESITLKYLHIKIINVITQFNLNCMLKIYRLKLLFS